MRNSVHGFGVAVVAAISATALTPMTATAQDFPDSPVQMIVPFPPGGGTDILGRIVAQQLSQAWDEPVVVENRPGAAGALGATQVMQTAPDGYTLLMASTGTLLGLAQQNPDEAFNIYNLLAPISLVAAPPYMVVVHPSVDAETIEEFIALAKANPGTVAYGTSGVGSASHLTGALFEEMAGVELLHIPYSGTGQAVTDLLSGEISVMFGPATTLYPHVESESLRAIAVTSAERSQLFPDIPTVAESGVEGYESVGWFGLFAPLGTPDEIIAQINDDLLSALDREEVREQLAEQSAEPAGMEPDAFGEWVNDDIVKWLSILERAE